MRAYLELLRRHPIVARLSAIQFVAYLGTWFSMVAVYVLMTRLGASPMLISWVAIMSFLPGILQAPIVGVIIDRMPFKPLMLTLLVVELVATAGLLFIDSLALAWLLLTLLFLRMGAASFYFTAEMSLLPQLLDSLALKQANELHSMIWAITYTVGMALGGVVVEFWGVSTAIVVDLLFFVVAISLFASIDVRIPKAPQIGSFVTQIIDGARYILHDKKVRYLLFVHASVGLTAYDALVALLADVLYKETIAVALSIGLVNAIRAIGLTLGPLLVGRYIRKTNLDIVMALQGVSILFWALMQPYFYPSLIAVFLVGFLTTSIWSLSYAMLQEATDHAYLGRVMSYNEMTFMSMSVLGSFLVGALFEYAHFTLPQTTAVLGALFLGMSLYYRRHKALFVG
ncbi:MAG: hypothetical protein KU37_06025 [Sulfuricurvum sp. PC08-66]|nr:MAG: hypothetical protein KU37_06025 [Sulfuricurvum sp. PC08-66]